MYYNVLYYTILFYTTRLWEPVVQTAIEHHGNIAQTVSERYILNNNLFEILFKVDEDSTYRTLNNFLSVI